MSVAGFIVPAVAAFAANAMLAIPHAAWTTPHPCADSSAWYCGEIRRPLDPTGTIPGTITIHFEWLPHRSRATPSSGMIVASEGGPGYGSTGSRAAYEALFHPLLDRRDLLLMDDRGTGRSGAIKCEPLQSEPTMTYASIARCGVQLGSRAALYGSGLAADDLAAILKRLRIRAVDMYGDSYGTFFVQTFAARHPERVRSMILDGAYPVIGDSPWYPAAAAVMRRSFDAVCRRSAPCASLDGSSMSRIARLVAALRDRPIRGIARVGAASRSVTVTPSALATVMDASGLATVPYRELDAAARAYLDAHDALPLVRLVGESYAANEDANSAGEYSRGLFTAVSCADYPQAYDMRLDPARRKIAWAAALAQKREDAADMFQPFTISEWLGMAPDYSVLQLCLDWPSPPSAYPPGQPIRPGERLPRTPALILSGELDTVTTPAEGDAVAALFPRARQIVMVNSAHVDALGDPYDCASRLARRFVQTLHVGDASCAQRIPELRTVPRFARRVNELTPAKAIGGNAGNSNELRAASAVVQTLADALARASWVSGNRDAGLRGGTIGLTSSGDIGHFHFMAARWTNDLAVSGEAEYDNSRGGVLAHLTTTGAARGSLALSWNNLAPAANAIVTGTLNGHAIRATLPAP
jgi:pimeloyl-ACP methyl ester carboxylesterase